ncbi:GNAT family N-acetyltransferase [uncultured Paraglaciecola sp.]|uniref:GNAT family N-acetyltransferase n=1 Tax=uncultured Paraglaciecola sp. TaxID=1765024 RepID=UPI0030DB2E40|tara:strand:+ start:170345 stop:170806 length:462 start_codon:yes stop_codon:yes gene_type:complete
MKIRAYHFGEEHEIWQLFYQTIHYVNVKDYSQKQLDAWAPRSFEQLLWRDKLAKLGSFVCVNSQQIIGYSDLQNNGYIDHFFCHSQYQGVGVGTALMAYIHTLAEQRSITHLSADVSITAMPFFENKGFKIVKQQAVQIRGQILGNYKMIKSL